MTIRYFKFSELYGPFPCEVDGCQAQGAFTIALTDKENKSLPEQAGPEAVKFIFDKKLGVAICDACIKKRPITKPKNNNTFYESKNG